MIALVRLFMIFYT